MGYDFDTMIDRTDRLSVKYDWISRGKPKGALPLWIADMDFKTAPCVADALRDLADHSIYGYSEPDQVWFDVIANWYATRFGWTLHRDWMINTPGVITALHLAVRALTAPGEAVLIQQPVYHPFEASVLTTGRRLVVNALVERAGRYEIDFDDFEQKIREEKVKLFILCNPHNPVGRVWESAELQKMGEICLRYGVIVVADEIHQDFIFDGHRHLVFANLSEEFSKISVSCTSPSKTFNLAGLQISNIFIADAGIRRKFKSEYVASGLSQPALAGLVACRAAYADGAGWLSSLIAYLDENMRLIETHVEQIKGVAFRRPEGSYLGWLDFRGLGLSDAALEDLLLSRAGVWLSPGQSFGVGGSGFMRINAAAPRSLVAEAMARIAGAVD
jgi:cystathionine beta-lyase